MSNKVKNKSVKKDVDFASKIKSIVGEVKNVTFEGFIKKIWASQFKDGIVVIMDIYDDTGNMTAIMECNRNEEIKKKLHQIDITLDKYRFTGDVKLVDNFTYDELKKLIRKSKRINKKMLTDKILVIQEIELIFYLDLL